MRHAQVEQVLNNTQKQIVNDTVFLRMKKPSKSQRLGKKKKEKMKTILVFSPRSSSIARTFCFFFFSPFVMLRYRTVFRD